MPCLLLLLALFTIMLTYILTLTLLLPLPTLCILDLSFWPLLDMRRLRSLLGTLSSIGQIDFFGPLVNLTDADSETGVKPINITFLIGASRVQSPLSNWSSLAYCFVLSSRAFIYL